MTDLANKPPATSPPRSIDYEDVGDIIGVAAELQQLDEDRLSVEELASVGRDSDIPEQLIAPAIAELRRRREAKLLAEARKARTRRWALMGAGAVVVVVIIWAIIGQSGLSSSLAEVAQKRAQVANVVERQRATHQQWDALPHSEERAAELSGAENRVRIERRRYDETAAAYNASAGAFPGSLWATIFGYPDEVPLSDALDSF